jgi:diacylglycerol kinase (ATP)
VWLASAALIVLSAAGPALLWWALVGLALATGLALELVNGALEALADRLHPGIHPEIGVAKDMASGAALVVNITAAGILAASVWQSP